MRPNCALILAAKGRIVKSTSFWSFWPKQCATLFNINNLLLFGEAEIDLQVEVKEHEDILLRIPPNYS